MNVDDLSEWRTDRTTLQRAVQVLKLHRNHYFADDLSQRLPSIIVTTLAARAYGGERDLFTAVSGIVDGMNDWLGHDGHIYVVTNPVDEEENFADR